MTALEQMQAELAKAYEDYLASRELTKAADAAADKARVAWDEAFDAYTAATNAREAQFEVECTLFRRWLDLNNAMMNAAHSKTVEE